MKIASSYQQVKLHKLGAAQLSMAINLVVHIVSGNCYLVDNETNVGFRQSMCDFYLFVMVDTYVIYLDLLSFH